MEFSRPEYQSGLPFPSLEGSSQPRDQTQVSHMAGRFFTVWATRECCKDISIINEIYCGYTAYSWKYSYLCIFFNLHIYILIVWHTGRNLEYRVTWVRIPSNPEPACMLSCFSVWLFATAWTVACPGSSVHGILQARIVECTAMPSLRGSSRPLDQTHVSCVSCIAGRFFTQCHLDDNGFFQ